ncbi:MAG TPA: hypothetical protein VD930_10395 [Gemmatimonadales bacterium]|nr:hypothetical protein [Gemmatimonadales bacterium]
MPSLPKEGDCYRARDTTTVRLLAMHGEAGMSFSAAELQRGEVIQIDENVEPGAARVWVLPVRYDELESVLVPAGDLRMPAYGGYMLFMDLQQLAADFERVQ